MNAVLSHPLFMPILVTLVIIAAFPLVAGYIVLVERKALADLRGAPGTHAAWARNGQVAAHRGRLETAPERRHHSRGVR